METCEHCGSKNTLDLICIYESEKRYSDDEDDYSWGQSGYRIFECKSCNNPTFYKTDFYSEDAPYRGDILLHNKEVEEATYKYKIFPKPFGENIIPNNILETLNMAKVSKHSNTISTAILLRKALELVCTNFEVEEGNLEKRLKLLKEKINITNMLFNDLNFIRRLGNKAAHDEKDFEIDKQTIEYAIEIVKFFLQQIYVYKSISNNFVSKIKVLKI